MTKPDLRPLRRDARRRKRRERVQEKLDYSTYKAERLEKELQWQEADLEKIEAKHRSFVANFQKLADNDRAIINSTIGWFITTPFAANLAGIWLLIPNRTVSHGTLYWSTIWFSLGVIASFIAGAVRLGVSYYNWNVVFSKASAAIAERDDADASKNLSALEGLKWLIAVCVAALVPIALFLAGAGVMIAERLAAKA